VLRVVDHGGGFRAEIADRLFTKYATGGGDGRGTGIGLWLVRRIIEAHGGRVSAGNRPGAGAEVVVRLPKVPVP
jgi:signal transduction histidine kinase